MDAPADPSIDAVPVPSEPVQALVAPTDDPSPAPAGAAPAAPPEHKPTDVRGYRALSPQELQVVNALKQKGEELAELLRSARLLGSLRDHQEADDCYRDAKRNFRQGFMWAVRSITQPSTFA